MSIIYLIAPKKQELKTRCSYKIQWPVKMPIPLKTNPIMTANKVFQIPDQLPPFRSPYFIINKKLSKYSKFTIHYSRIHYSKNIKIDSKLQKFRTDLHKKKQKRALKVKRKKIGVKGKTK